ncbi:MAG: beta-eliminating lyase-related protein [Promicromonosporaceae bacterium]|nr:beta-eliminating lyase-related protein [Promicromonosporaceae bacterium]
MVAGVETSFASDNYAPVHPEVLAALTAANEGYAPAYAADALTEQLDERVEEIFGWGSLAFPVLNGTGANVVSLMATTPRWGGVIATDVAHVNTDENGAVERVGGLKVLMRPSGVDAKLTVDDVLAWRDDIGTVHRAQPAVITITQATEVGTVYRPAELRELADTAHELGMAVHMDGARLANAAAFLGCGLRDIVTEVGVDLLSLGAAKNGGMLGEAIVVVGSGDATTTTSAEIRRAAAESVPYLRKSTMQLASKSRFISAQLLALLGQPASYTGGRLPMEQRLWLKNARVANQMAARLRSQVEAIEPDVIRISRPTEANGVFATLPRALADEVRPRFHFYDWGPGETDDRVEVRWMCSWCTTKAEVDDLAQALAAAAKSYGG